MPDVADLLASGSSFLASVPDVILAILGIIAVLAGMVGFARGSFAKAQIAALRGDRDDLAERVRIVEDAKEKLEVDFEAYKVTAAADLHEETARREALELVVTGKQELQQVITILDAHDRRAVHIEEVVVDIAAKVGDRHE